MLFGPNTRYFNELEIDGEHIDDSENEDYTNDSMDLEDDEDDIIDYTEEEFDDEVEEGESETVTDDAEDEPETTTENDDLTDYTDEEFEDDDTLEEPETAETDDGTDDEQIENDDLTDYTDEEFEDDEGADEETNADDADTNEDTASDNTNDENAESDDSNDNTLAGMEKNLFSDLTPQQLAIKNNELLHNYIELYETISTIFDNINKIPKNIDNTRPLTFIADQLVELKDMVNYTITTTYVTRTYVENMAYYKQALVVLEQLNTMLKALIQKPTK